MMTINEILLTILLVNNGFEDDEEFCIWMACHLG